MHKISIIVPCYNNEKYIAECLDSILGQKFNDWEAIVVNDGSTDNSLAIINEYAKKDKRIKVINQKNQGVVVARNNAVKKSKGKFIYPLDGDDIISSNCLEVLYNNITTTKNRVVASEVETFGAENSFFMQPKFNKIEMYGKHECCVISALFYKEDFIKFGGYKEEFNGYGGDDMDYWLNYIDNNMPMHRVSDVLFFYRIKEDYESSWKNYDKEKFKERIEYKNKLLMKHHPKMKFYIRLYKIINLLYKVKITKSGKKIVKICKIPIYSRRIK